MTSGEQVSTHSLLELGLFPTAVPPGDVGVATIVQTIAPSSVYSGEWVPQTAQINQTIHPPSSYGHAAAQPIPGISTANTIAVPAGIPGGVTATPRLKIYIVSPGVGTGFQSGTTVLARHLPLTGVASVETIPGPLVIPGPVILLNTGITGDEAIGTMGLYDLDTTDPHEDPINEEGQGIDPIFGGVVESVF